MPKPQKKPSPTLCPMCGKTGDPKFKGFCAGGCRDLKAVRDSYKKIGRPVQGYSKSRVDDEETILAEMAYIGYEAAALPEDEDRWFGEDCPDEMDEDSFEPEEDFDEEAVL